MSRKLSAWDMLRFAEEGDDDDGDNGEGEGGEQGGGDAKGGSESDIAKVRADLQKEIAELRKQNQELQSQMSGTSSKSAAQAAYNRAVTQVQGLIDDLGEYGDDTEAALKKAIGHLQAAGGMYAEAMQRYTELAGDWKATKAESLAIQIQIAGGGDIDTYRAQLMKGRDIKEMELIADNLKSQVSGRRRASGNGDAGNGSQRRPAPDGGRGTATRSDLLSQMSDIDTSTPEGQKLWEEKRGEFQRQIRQQASTR